MITNITNNLSNAAIYNITNNFSSDPRNVPMNFGHDYSSYDYIPVSFNDILVNFNHQFLTKIELVLGMFAIMMIYLNYYTKKLEDEQYTNKKWREHLAKSVNIYPIIESDDKISFKDEWLIRLTYWFSIAAFAFPIIFIGYETGWYI